MIVKLIIALVFPLVILNLAGAIAMSINKGADLSGEQQWLLPVIMQSGILVLSLAAILIVGKGKLRSYGFAKPANLHIIPSLVVSLAIGTMAALILSRMPGSSHPLEKMFSTPQVIAYVWVYASISEEVLFRGLVQGYLAPLADRGLTFVRRRMSLPVIFSAVMFGLMHFSLLQAGMKLAPVMVIVMTGFILGGLAGYQREQTGSLAPAVLIHAMFNISGSIVGWLLPSMP